MNLDLHRGATWVAADFARLQRMVRNLLHNAERHATSRIDVSVRQGRYHVGSSSPTTDRHPTC